MKRLEQGKSRACPAPVPLLRTPQHRIVLHPCIRESRSCDIRNTPEGASRGRTCLISPELMQDFRLPTRTVLVSRMRYRERCHPCQGQIPGCGDFVASAAGFQGGGIASACERDEASSLQCLAEPEQSRASCSRLSMLCRTSSESYQNGLQFARTIQWCAEESRAD